MYTYIHTYTFRCESRPDALSRPASQDHEDPQSTGGEYNLGVFGQCLMGV